MAFEMNSIGRHIGNYRITAQIGIGGFARVYRGEHLLLKERTVAIKFLHTFLSSDEERHRFLQEASLLETLRHPHILLIYDVGIDQGFPYLVTEFAAHGSLRDRLLRQPSHPLPLAEALTILTQVGEALAHAHTQHIIHRDLKPANILFTGKGEALLADFGIATTLATASFQSTKITGTPSYMAPEQFQGKVCKESDQYALGRIAYELVTGRPPFAAENVFATGYKHLTEEPPAPRELNPNLPVAVEQAIRKAMAKERSHRYPHIHAFIEALQGSAGAALPPVSLNPSIPQPTTPHLAFSDVSVVPTLSPPDPLHAVAETGEHVIQHLPHENTTDRTRFMPPPVVYQETVPPSSPSPVTLPPTVFQNTPLPLQSQTPGSPAHTSLYSRMRGTKRPWLILSLISIMIIASIVSALVFAAFPGTSQGRSSFVTNTQTSVAVTTQLPTLTATSKGAQTPGTKSANTPASKLLIPGTTATPLRFVLVGDKERER